jgi:hypothetical protein
VCCLQSKVSHDIKVTFKTAMFSVCTVQLAFSITNNVRFTALDVLYVSYYCRNNQLLFFQITLTIFRRVRQMAKSDY